MLAKIIGFAPYAVCCCLISAICACLIMWVAYGLPTDKIRDNTRASIASLSQTPKIMDYTFAGKRLDVFTDSLILGMASLKLSEGAFTEAMKSKRPDFGVHPFYNLLMSLNTEQPLPLKNITTYARYWHGYLSILKPLLTFFNLEQIRIVNYICQIVLLMVALFFIAKKISLLYSIAFLITILFINPVSTGWCLEYSTSYYIMLITVIYLLYNVKANEMKVFLFTGIALAFLDFPVCPLISLGIPLITLIGLRQDKLHPINVLICCITWFMGYAGMWICKWLFVTVSTSLNTIQDGFQTFWYRLFGDGSKEIGQNIGFSPIMAISRNLADFPNDVFFMVAVGWIVCCYLVKKLSKKSEKIRINMLSVLWVGVLPFLWYSLVVNHSIIHSWMTYRNLSVTVFACLVYMMGFVFNNKIGNGINNKVNSYAK